MLATIPSSRQTQDWAVCLSAHCLSVKTFSVIIDLYYYFFKIHSTGHQARAFEEAAAPCILAICWSSGSKFVPCYRCYTQNRIRACECAILRIYIRMKLRHPDWKIANTALTALQTAGWSPSISTVRIPAYRCCLRQ